MYIFTSTPPRKTSQKNRMYVDRNLETNMHLINISTRKANKADTDRKVNNF
jgi:hypothetical protein